MPEAHTAPASTPVPDTETLAGLSTRELLAIFERLPCPTVAELNGEYAARLLRVPDRGSKRLWMSMLYNPVFPGHWLGKAFAPVSTDRGHGYNFFRHRGRGVRRFPMATQLAPSRHDGELAYQLVYADYLSVCGALNMVDEIRRLDARRYLGFGRIGYTPRQLSVPIPFLLTGPDAEFAGGIGTPRGWHLPFSVRAN